MDLNSHFCDILRSCTNTERAKHHIQYKKSRFPSFGCTMPQLRSVAKKEWKRIAHTHPKQDLAKHVDALWKQSEQFDVLTIALLYFDQKSTLTKNDWDILKGWSLKIDNWAHSDALSCLYARLMDNIPDIVLPQLQAWNTDAYSWNRRLSLTSIYYYSRQRTTPIPAEASLPLVEHLLTDTDFYVQRAVGWTLRECGNLYPEKTTAFIRRYATVLSSIAFTTAVEKWPPEKKQPLKELRKTSRAR